MSHFSIGDKVTLINVNKACQFTGKSWNSVPNNSNIANKKFTIVLLNDNLPTSCSADFLHCQDNNVLLQDEDGVLVTTKKVNIKKEKIFRYYFLNVPNRGWSPSMTRMDELDAIKMLHNWGYRSVANSGFYHVDINKMQMIIVIEVLPE